MTEAEDFGDYLQVLRIAHSRQGQFHELGLLHLLDNDPVRTDSNGRFALLNLHGSVVILTSTLLLPFTHLTLTLSGNRRVKSRFKPRLWNSRPVLSRKIQISRCHVELRTEETSHSAFDVTAFALAAVLLSHLGWYHRGTDQPRHFQPYFFLSIHIFTVPCSSEPCSTLEDWPRS